MGLQELVIENSVKRALIIDDAYDVVPEAEDIYGVDVSKVVAALHSEPVDIRTALGQVLIERDLEEDEFEEGLNEDKFIAKLWELAESGALQASTSKLLFEVYRALQEQKREQLKPLEALLKDELHLAVETQGRESSAVAEWDLLFLDLFLGVTDDDNAIKSAIARVKRLIANMADEARPLVVVMSTKAGIELSTLASRLQAEASLLGCKFRTVSKLEFDKVLPQILEQLLKDRPKAQMVARWLDTWRAAITAANDTFVEKLRSLDLSDYAYLQKFRLDAEGVDLGTYLRPTLLDFLSYCVEENHELSRQASELDKLSFEQAPHAHFLPSDRVTELAHARTFLNRAVLEVSGLQVDDVSKQLQLGDVIVKKPAGASGYGFGLDGVEALVVITQACDIQQDNTDAFLMLRGTIHLRDWTADLAPIATRTDVFIWNGVDYSLDWERAKVVSLKRSTLQSRLGPNGGYARIARFRDVEALRIQNLFASHLTRIGVAVSFHHRAEVGLQLLVKANDQPRVLYAATIEEKMAALIDGRMLKPPRDGHKERKSENSKVLIFDRMFPERFAAALLLADYTDVAPVQAGQLKSFAGSTEDLNRLRVEHRVTKPIALSDNLKIELKWDKLPEDWKGAPTLLVLTPGTRK